MKNQSGNNGKGRQITSPDQLHDYLHVTNASVWIVLVAVILLLIVSLIWSANASIDSYTDATAKVTGKSMVVTIDDPAMQNRIKSGMTILVGDTTTKVTSIGHSADGNAFAVAATSLADGTYAARIIYKQEKVLSLLFNGEQQSA